MPVIWLVNPPVILRIDSFFIRYNICLPVNHAAAAEHNPPAVINTFINIRQILITIKINRPFQPLYLLCRYKIKISTVKVNHRLDLFQKLSAHLVKIICRIDLINNTVEYKPVICFKIFHWLPPPKNSENKKYAKKRTHLCVLNLNYVITYEV